MRDMYHKLSLKIKAIILIIICFNISLYEVQASTIKQETSSDGITTYYVSTHEENRLALNMIKARKEVDSKIVYTEEMAQNEYAYLEDVNNYKNMPQNDIINVGYGIGIDYSDSISPKSKATNGTRTVLYTSYYTETPEQTKYVYDKIHTAIKSDLSELVTDYQKAHWAYQFVLDNLYYDHSYINKSPYDGLSGIGTICIGYASLYCAVASELGLDCRYMEGLVNKDGVQIEHAWNIIQIDHKWYCVDTTWGDGGYGDKYFLKSKETFELPDYGMHVSSLYANYISAGEIFSSADYTDTGLSEVHDALPSVYNIDMDILKRNTIEIGETYEFMIDNTENGPIYFKSSDSSIAKVNSKGKVIGLASGMTTITAYNTELNIEQNCEITVVSAVTSITEYKSLSIKTGQMKKLSFEIVPSSASLQGLTYKSSNKNIAVVDYKGNVTGINKGKTTIKVICRNGKSIEIRIIIK